MNPSQCARGLRWPLFALVFGFAIGCGDTRIEVDDPPIANEKNGWKPYSGSGASGSAECDPSLSPCGEEEPGLSAPRVDPEPSTEVAAPEPAAQGEPATEDLNPAEESPPSQPANGEEPTSPSEDEADPNSPPEPSEDPPQEEEPLPAFCETGPMKKDQFTAPKVYYGTEYPEYLPMTDGQIMAVGTFWGCSGLLIAPTWVLSASHCGLWTGDEFCMGPDADNPWACVPLANVYDHWAGDISVAELAFDARDLLPDVVPVPILTDNMDQNWIGQTGEAAGYGSQEDGGFGEREFTAEPIVYLWADTLTIDGLGKQGVCFGDSGGPVMVIATDGSVRVAGALSGGDEWCTGQDNFTRVDTYRDWIEGYTGPTVPPGPQECGSIDTIGSCNAGGTTATYCGGDDILVVETCPVGTVCSWYDVAGGWRCIDPSIDPCGGITHWGQCNGNLLSWCGEGGLLTRDCGQCSETCVPNDDMGYFCVPSTCGDLLFEGQCTGNTVEWCNREGEPENMNCPEYGMACAWIDEATGFYCTY